MEKALTLRLSDDEIIALNELKKIGDEKSVSKIIRYVILRFKDVSDELKMEIARNRKLTAELNELKRKVNEFNTAFRQLCDVK